MHHGVRTLSTLGLLARLALGAYALLCAAILLISLLAILPIGLGSVIPVLGFGAGLVSFLWLGAFAVSVVAVASWVWRAHANLHEAGLQGLTYSPGWATASFFVPLANLYVPFASTRELYNRSQGESDWHKASPVGDVTSWYACNWGALAVLIVALGYFAVNAIPNVYVILPPFAWYLLGALVYILLAGSAFFMFRIVLRVTAAQEASQHLGAADTFD